MDFGILKLIGIIVFLYLTWRNLRDNYKERELITYGWLAVLSFFIGGRLFYGLMNWGIWNNNWLDWFSFINKPGINYVGGYITTIISTYFISKYYGWKIWSFAEDMVQSFIVFLIFLLAGNWLYFGILLLGLIVSFLLKKKYRSFVWYKSGKKGFIFFLANFVIWLLLGISSFWLKFGIIYSISYLITSLIFLVGLGILGKE